MLSLNNRTVFLEKEGYGFIYNWNQKKLLKTNLTVITLLKLCDGNKKTRDIINFFDASIQNQIEEVVQELLRLEILKDNGTQMKSRNYEDIVAFFLSLTHRCNLNCHFCLKHNPTEYKELDLKQWMDIVDIIEQFNEQEKVLYLSGGEPLLMNSFCELYQYIFQKGMKINIYSNGTLFREEILFLLKKYPPNAVLLSIDGSTGEIHDRQRGVAGAFDKLLESTRQLTKIESNIFWQVVVDRNNLDDMENIAKLACENGISHLNFSVISAIGKGIENASRLTVEQMVQFYEKCFDLVFRYKGKLIINRPIGSVKSESGVQSYCSCGIGNMIHINEQGYVSPCYGWDLGKFRNGPIKSLTELKEIRFTEFYHRAVTDYKACSACGIRNICKGGCKVEIYNLTGSLHGCNLDKKAAIENFILRHMLQEEKVNARRINV